MKILLLFIPCFLAKIYLEPEGSMKRCSSTRSFTARLKKKKNLLELSQPINSIAHLFQWFLSLLFSSFESILKLMENVFIFLLIHEQNDLKLFVLCVFFFFLTIFSARIIINGEKKNNQLSPRS